MDEKNLSKEVLHLKILLHQKFSNIQKNRLTKILKNG